MMRMFRTTVPLLVALSMLAACEPGAAPADATAGPEPAPASAPEADAPATPPPAPVVEVPVDPGLACNVDQQYFGGETTPFGTEVEVGPEQYLAGAGWMLDKATGLPPAAVAVVLRREDAPAAAPIREVVETGIARPGALQGMPEASRDALPGFRFAVQKDALVPGRYVMSLEDGAGGRACGRTWQVVSL